MTSPTTLPYGQIPSEITDHACTLNGLTAITPAGNEVSLDKCDWVLTSQCGCIRGVLLAYCGPSHIMSTELKAWREFESRKADREAAIKRGCRMFLLDHDDYRAIPDHFMLGPCPHKAVPS